MQRIEIDLDDIEVERLCRYSSINKTSPKELIQQAIDEWLASIDEDEGKDLGRH